MTVTVNGRQVATAMTSPGGLEEFALGYLFVPLCLIVLLSLGKRDFTARYLRWAVMQRRIAGTGAYAAMALLNPVLLALGACLADPDGRVLGAAAAVAAAKAILDGASARRLRPAAPSPPPPPSAPGGPPAAAPPPRPPPAFRAGRGRAAPPR